MSRRKPPLTELGRALRERDADLRSGWERDYGGAIRAALAGDAARLLDLLRAHRRPVTADALTDVDLDRLADFIEVTAKRPPGRERDPAVHAAARIAATLLSTRAERCLPRCGSAPSRKRARRQGVNTGRRSTGSACAICSTGPRRGARRRCERNSHLSLETFPVRAFRLKCPS